ncbi:hypothetical protein FACS1894208_08960 [Clostridia bacterium]|nr:hypothetical protein FACS1894208_08960 [Clostridia bacterium]
MPDSLIDIRDIQIDGTLTKRERILQFLRQIINPHRFRCGAFTVTVRYTENGPTLEECLRNIVT